MSIRDDFSMYYRGTYIGARQADGTVVPFFVDNVDGGGRDYSETSKNSLVFLGRSVLAEDVEFGQIRMDSGNVVLELPELGYIQHRGSHYWLRYRPQHIASKGLTGRRVAGLMQINDHIARAIYAAITAQPNHSARQFAFVGESLLYKDRTVGTIREGGEIQLNEAAVFLRGVLAKAFPDKVIL